MLHATFPLSLSLPLPLLPLPLPLPLSLPPVLALSRCLGDQLSCSAA